MFLFSATRTKHGGMHFPSLVYQNTFVIFLSQVGTKNSHSMVSLKVPKSPTPHTPRTYTLHDDFPVGESSVKPPKDQHNPPSQQAAGVSAQTLETSEHKEMNRVVFPRLSFEEISDGFSIYVIIPNKRKPDGIGLTNKQKTEDYDIPCKRRTVVCLDTFRMYAHWRLGQRTADIEK